MGSTRVPERDMVFKRKPPSLLQLCIQTTIDNVRYLGDVGETDIHLLKDILPHCTSDQLMHIEKSTKGRDLSSVTNKLWRRFFEENFGIKSFNIVRERLKAHNEAMKQQNEALITWREVYEAKLKDCDELQKMQADRLKKLYKKVNDDKQSRQIQICSKVPPSSNKRKFYGGSGTYNSISNTKGNLMKKARMEYLNSHEAKLAIRKNALKRSQGVPRSVKPFEFPGKCSASSSKFTKPFRRA